MEGFEISLHKAHTTQFYFTDYAILKLYLRFFIEIDLHGQWRLLQFPREIAAQSDIEYRGFWSALRMWNVDKWWTEKSLPDTRQLFVWLEPEREDVNVHKLCLSL